MKKKFQKSVRRENKAMNNKASATPKKDPFNPLTWGFLCFLLDLFDILSLYRRSFNPLTWGFLCFSMGSRNSCSWVSNVSILLLEDFFVSWRLTLPLERHRSICFNPLTWGFLCFSYGLPNALHIETTFQSSYLRISLFQHQTPTIHSTTIQCVSILLLEDFFVSR